MRIDPEELKQRLEEVGEVKVRERLSGNIYGPQERPIVEEWLLSKEREKSDKRMEEYIKIARSAKRAAWIAAIAAFISALAAIAAWIW
jgi:L-fucose isomerase-like protein